MLYKYTFSIVSHNQIHLVEKLLNDFKNIKNQSFQIIVTLNTDELFFEDNYNNDLNIIVIRNEFKLGFGENHNNAFKYSNSEFFCVVNPDIKFQNLELDLIDFYFKNPEIGVVAPKVLNFNNNIEDSVRLYPTIINLMKRKLFRKRFDYKNYNSIMYVDWAAGMFMFFRSIDFSCLMGFDINYFMYLEDTDICLKYKLNGFKILYTPELVVFHDARRNSRKSFRHFLWHIKSFIYFYLKNIKNL